MVFSKLTYITILFAALSYTCAGQTNALNTLNNKIVPTPVTKGDHQALNPRTLNLDLASSLNIGFHKNSGGSSLSVDLCVDLSLQTSRSSLDFSLVSSLRARINANGVSAAQLGVLQAQANAQLKASARVSTTAYACQIACTNSANTCASSSYNQRTQTCTLRPVVLTRTSPALANLAGNMAMDDSSASRYCSICPYKCQSQPSAAARLRKRAPMASPLCPIGLDACPINGKIVATGYECIDTKQEMDSCGGCSSTGEGIDCNTLPGVKSVGCAVGKCVAFSCQNGYYLNQSQTCVRRN